MSFKALGIIFLDFFLLFLFSPKTVYASGNFSVSNDVTYAVSQQGLTHTTFTMALSNNSSHYYASTYSIKLGIDDLVNVKVSDPTGNIIPKITKTARGSSISFLFNKPSVGIGKMLPFTISFDTREIAYKLGNVWEINIPGLSDQNDFSNVTVTVTVPQSFGTPTYIKPFYQITPNQYNQLIFTKDQLQKSGISIGYGQSQSFDFKLMYHLQNNNLFPAEQEIALPPDTNYQSVLISRISQKPLQVRKDLDGNWLAKYYIYPFQKKDITVTGSIYVNLLPDKQPLSQADKIVYLQDQPYWQVSDPKIKSIAKSLKTPFAIYKYGENTLVYDYSRVTKQSSRLGAAALVKNPKSAVCLEFTDLFIALSRAAGIPAREVDGFAYTYNSKQQPTGLVQDVLHAWPEYYDDDLQTWIMVDPTWANTTGGTDYFNMLDFDHIAFSIKGTNSSYPIPAGGYKTNSSKNNHDVTVSVSTTLHTISKPSFQIQTHIRKEYLSELPIDVGITLQNQSGSVLALQKIQVSSQALTPNSQTIFFDEIPPYGSLTKQVSFKSDFFTNKISKIIIKDNQKVISQIIVVKPLVISWITILEGGVFVAGISFVISIIAVKSWRIFIFG